MRVDDSNNYTTISYAAEGGYTGDFWNFGKEIWCNKEGQYTTIVADFKHLANKENFYPGLCSLPIMGTRYIRDTNIASTLSLDYT